MEISYISGEIEFLDRIKSLWHGLNDHHAAVSTHFSSHFKKFTFETRVSSIKKKAKEGSLLIAIAIENKSNDEVGYCISSVDSDNQGEIDSIYIKPEYRNKGIARGLMNQAIKWLHAQEVNDISIGVVHGNEQVYAFYSKFGFFPKVMILQNR